MGLEGDQGFCVHLHYNPQASHTGIDWYCMRPASFQIDIAKVCDLQHVNGNSDLTPVYSANNDGWDCDKGQKSLGGLDLRGYCNSLNYDTAVPDSSQQNWSCQGGSPPSLKVDWGQACNWQYGQWITFPRNRDNTDLGWQCYGW